MTQIQQKQQPRPVRRLKLPKQYGVNLDELEEMEQRLKENKNNTVDSKINQLDEEI